MITDNNIITDILAKSGKRNKRPSPYQQGYYAKMEGNGPPEKLCAYQKNSLSYQLWMAGFTDYDEEYERCNKELEQCFPNGETYIKDFSYQGSDGL